ncbi:hypothetical protein PC129_g25023 [Phytophthora cactorum]|uniref:CDR ABC transporter n=1 Tax=Phytophthora cactorum TaxID=29920 RepID=A0A8T1H0C4_9STRA|nr:hypothetical protein PC129_g25023 [Phytophthora cactorum]
MYRLNPFTYVVEGFLGTSLANAPVAYAAEEFVEFSAPTGSNCGEYMAPFLETVGGYVKNNSSIVCEYCAMADTNAFLSGIHISFDNRWRDFGIMWAYCIFNVAVAVGLYWLVRVPKNSFKKSAN